MAFCDLHTHSIYSDGTDSPAQLLAQAQALGLSHLALTDHNTVDGLPEFLEAAKATSVVPVCGVEFTVDMDGTELHLLALGLVPAHFPIIRERLCRLMEQKEESSRLLVSNLRKAGFDLDYDAIAGTTPHGMINRSHIAAALTQKGYTETNKEAFTRLLDPKVGYYQEPERLDFWDALAFIRELGAVSILAHPLYQLSEEALRAALPKAIEAGLMGMESVYGSFTPQQRQLAYRIAEEHGLLHSGGSDYHGPRKPSISLGIGKGDLQVPSQWALAILDKLNG
ncbi:MAG: PHP domain-containing protein [Ruminococcaceae bacterium]|nr:PHP domain-containing protein [Oscillospiraceae bacterium]